MRKVAATGALALMAALATVVPPTQMEATAISGSPVQPVAEADAGSAVRVAATARGAGKARLRVASFNVLNVAAATPGALRSWKKRRAAVVATIMSDRPDVIGVQEVNPNPFRRRKLVSGDNQYYDLRNGLRRAGGHYRLTNQYAYNCVKALKPRKCVRKMRGASGSQRILYNARRVTLVRQGAVKYTRQAGRKDPRYIAWAVLRLKSNGRTFLFVNTHLADKPERVLVAQWKQLASWVKRHRHGRPVVVVGDFNTSKWNAKARTMLPMMKRSGFGDVLNQEYRVLRPDPVRARSIRRSGWIWTYNQGSRNVRRFSYHARRDVPGKGIDMIFASNWLRVPEYRVVLRFDRRTLRVRGNLPSDHNMVRADLLLP